MMNFRKRVKEYLGITSRYDVIKVLVMAACFFLVLSCYTVIKELKDSVFVLVVGQKYLPDVKNLSYLFMIPLIFFYSWLAGKVRRQSLLIFYSIVYSLGGFISAYFMHHPTIGLANQIASGGRLFGWIFYLFLEGYSPFLVSLLWAFMNSISRPEEIRSRYVFVTVASKLGGAIGAGLAWLFMSKYFVVGQALSEVVSHVYVLVAVSCAILLVPVLMIYLTYAVPASYLKGYSEDKTNKECKIENNTNKEHGHKSGSGFMLIFRYWYVFGIFAMIFFWEAINVVFNYMRLGVVLKESDSITGFSALLFKNAMMTHMVGLVIALIGTSWIVRLLGERLALMTVPLFVGGAIITCLLFPSSQAVIATYIFIRAINYALFYPLKEGLYIPTSNAIKFKAKSWIDSFGSKLSKAIGGLYNKIIHFVPAIYLQSTQMSFFIGIIMLWTTLAYFMGSRWAGAVKKGEVIGDKECM